MLDNFGDAADVGGNDGNFAGHGFESGKAEGFELRRKKTSFWRPCLRTRNSAAPRSGPSPMRTSLAGILARTSAKISTASVTRLTGRKFDRCMRMGSRLGAHSAASPLSAVRL